MIPKFNEYKERFQMESKDSIEPGLESITRALEKLGNPHRKLTCIHVAGTNGKGSTIAMMNSMLQAQGVKTACFYSPCFVDVHDQIQLNGEHISREQLDHVFQLAKEAGLSGTVTDFELLTILAFMAFEQFKPDIVLLETGMGGRYDSTNVITPLISVIPSIAIEHEKFLGNTIEEVASHKAGIIKKSTPVAIGPLDEVARKVIVEEAMRQHAALWIFGRDFTLGSGQYRDNDGHVLENVSVPLKGLHQHHNAALAIRAVLYTLERLGMKWNEELLQLGLNKTFIPGRFEKITESLYFDGAHNPASAQALVETIKEIYPETPIHFYIGMIEGKDVEKILRIFEKISSNFTFIDFKDERSMSSQKMSKISKALTINSTNEPLDILQKNILNNHVTIVTGSLYLLSTLRIDAFERFKII